MLREAVLVLKGKSSQSLSLQDTHLSCYIEKEENRLKRGRTVGEKQSKYQAT